MSSASNGGAARVSSRVTAGVVVSTAQRFPRSNLGVFDIAVFDAAVFDTEITTILSGPGQARIGGGALFQVK